MYSRYTTDLNELDFEQEELVSDEKGGQANYLIRIIEANQKKFLAHAVSVTDYDGDGIYNTWQIDEKNRLKELVKD